MTARTKATMEEKRENKALTISFARALGYNKKQITCLVTLWTRESRFDHLADNKRSTAYDTLVTAMEGVRVALSNIQTEEAGTDSDRC